MAMINWKKIGKDKWINVEQNLIVRVKEQKDENANRE